MDFEVVARGQNDVFLHKHKPCDWEPIENINDPYVQEMGRFAVMEYRILGVKLEFIRVVGGETLEVAEGKKFRLVVEVKEEIIVPSSPWSIKFYIATVLDKQCDRSWKLLSFEPCRLPPLEPGVIIPNA